MRNHRRFGSVIRLKPGAEATYRRLHASVWPEVLSVIDRCNLRNYSIFLRRLTDGRDWLFAVADPVTRRWWAETAPLQDPLPDRTTDSWWAPMEEVFRHDGPEAPTA
jgi:L-rhamnose mutarotase